MPKAKKKGLFSAIKKWSTRKKTLMLALLAVIIYTVSDMAITIIYANTGMSVYFDPVLTTEFFEFMKLISGLGGGLTAAEIISGAVRGVRENSQQTGDDEVRG